jgi:dihydropteroate synthase
MGIINVTPDSFYDGGKTTALTPILAQADKMIAEGATFLDVGGYSSRPGATHISQAAEIERVLPAIKAILDNFPEALISIDTFRSEVAKQAIAAGAAIVNDISGGIADTNMFEVVGKLQVPYVLMHMKGNPQTMASYTDYNDITRDVLFYFSERIALAKAAGIADIIADPGFGFAKTRQQSFELLNDLDLFKMLEVPLLVGLSRKSMIYKTLGSTPQSALNGSTVLNTIALLKGAHILRVHDVKEAVECVQLTAQLRN